MDQTNLKKRPILRFHSSGKDHYFKRLYSQKMTDQKWNKLSKALPQIPNYLEETL
jgi:hypothetical protein